MVHLAINALEKGMKLYIPVLCHWTLADAGNVYLALIPLGKAWVHTPVLCPISSQLKLVMFTRPLKPFEKGMNSYIPLNIIWGWLYSLKTNILGNGMNPCPYTLFHFPTDEADNVHLDLMSLRKAWIHFPVLSLISKHLDNERLISIMLW